MTLYLNELDIDLGRVVHPKHRGTSDDIGYFLHGWLAGVFGPKVLQPFRLMDGPRGARILGYSTLDATALMERADQFAQPEARQGVRALRSKPMPSSWRAGQRVGFTVRAVPVVRHRPPGHASKNGIELDVFLKRRRSEAYVTREQAYSEWVAGQLERRGGVTLDQFTLDQHRLVRLVRPDHGKGIRKPVPLSEMQATGSFVVTNETDMNALLTSGIGRHRAFGFGMLLLRPPPC